MPPAKDPDVGPILGRARGLEDATMVLGFRPTSAHGPPNFSLPAERFSAGITPLKAVKSYGLSEGSLQTGRTGVARRRIQSPGMRVTPEGGLCAASPGPRLREASSYQR